MVNRLTQSVEHVGRSRPRNPSSRLRVTFALSLCLNEYKLRVHLKPFSTSMCMFQFVRVLYTHAPEIIKFRGLVIPSSLSTSLFELLEKGEVLGTRLLQSEEA